MPERRFRKPSQAVRDTVARNTRQLRRREGLSQEALAAKAGLHRTYIGSVERSERNLTLSSLEAISTALRVTLPQLLSSDGSGE